MRFHASALAVALISLAGTPAFPASAVDHSALANPGVFAIAPPADSAYFGAWANPAGTSHPSPAEVETDTETLESQIGRSLSLHMHYYGWGAATTPSFPDAAMQLDASRGRTPVVTWACGDSDANVTAGIDDALIANTADAVKAFGAPIFVRWYWEMNLKAGANGQDCLGADGATGYIAAWQHIRTVFDNHGVRNVAWLWNPAAGAASLASGDPAPYYPGDAFVDWIGFDGYDKIVANDFGPVLAPFYNAFSAHGKPFLIAETGECQDQQQATYLASAQAEIEGASNPGGYSFPLVKGFMYFDAPGNYVIGHPGCAWSFSVSGLAAFTTMGADAYFAARLNDTIFIDGFDTAP